MRKFNPEIGNWKLDNYIFKDRLHLSKNEQLHLYGHANILTWVSIIYIKLREISKIYDVINVLLYIFNTKIIGVKPRGKPWYHDKLHFNEYKYSFIAKEINEMINNSE